MLLQSAKKKSDAQVGCTFSVDNGYQRVLIATINYLLREQVKNENCSFNQPVDQKCILIPDRIPICVMDLMGVRLVEVEIVFAVELFVHLFASI